LPWIIAKRDSQPVNFFAVLPDDCIYIHRSSGKQPYFKFAKDFIKAKPVFEDFLLSNKTLNVHQKG
jgi:hypothetical protein